MTPSCAQCVATHELVPAEPHANGDILFEAYLDGELIGEIRDDTNGRILRPCVILDGLTEVAELVINLKTSEVPRFSMNVFSSRSLRPGLA
jgi:hypothetical protein